MTKDDKTGQYASPPCLAHEVDPTYFDPLAVDPQQASDVARWRKVERARLLEARAALSVAARQAAAQAIAGHLDQFLEDRFGTLQGLTVSAWWPIKAELDLRFWLEGLAARGARGALPIVATRAAPLIFRVWNRQARMERGFWNIPVPAEGAPVLPDITLSPVVGWDAESYRLGYGGGYFDRTLAAASPRPLAIGIGLDAARIPTIFPQPHDIAMQAIITETGTHFEKGRP
ncbi:MAG TPA: 5-formyltetrahydrofolate cyclo-ligase [Paracoccaceae bacterium]|nr:5-formyltetrahydrofolate cyclo-ligase [Paracoccaceae bacterium]